MTGAHSPCAADSLAPETPELLPELREDLQLVASSELDDGSPSWTIIDPLQLHYYRIGWQEFEILSRWHCRESAAIVAQVNQHTTLAVTSAQVDEVARFLKGHNLVKAEQYEPLYQQYLTLSKKNIVGGIIRNYLFFKIPLFQPDRFLSATMPLVRFFFSPIFWGLVCCVGFFASYLTMRQLDSFQQTFIYFFSFEGMIYYAAALTFTKVLHEFGHAYTAKRYGLRVPTMGLAFILLWPILYTDTTDAWRLRSAKQRLQVGCAGMLIEICTAIAATFLWNFMPDGPARSAVFFLATTTWLVTISINLNPFMRFDGYYILSDLLDVPNLRQQAFSLAKWRLRKLLFGFSDACPVNLPRLKKRIILLYAYSTWIYRFFLFLGIALLVYHYTFKVLGIFLMAFEITMFITLPVAREIRTWWQRRSEIGLNLHLLSTLSVFCCCVIATLYPWPTIIHIPATYETAAYTTIYPPQNGQLISVDTAHNDLKSKGQTLFTLHSAELVFRSEQAQREIDVLRLQLKKTVASRRDEEHLQVIQQKLSQKLTALKGYEEQINQLRVVAPWTGRVLMPSQPRPGQWVNRNEPLLALLDENTMTVTGFVHEEQFHLIQSGDSGLFYDETAEVDPFTVTIEDIDHIGSKYLTKPYLASTFGGAIPVDRSKDGKLTTHGGYYKVTMRPANTELSNHVIRGSVRFQGKPQNFFERVWPQVAAVFIRESGF